jgi:hypothetical protein
VPALVMSKRAPGLGLLARKVPVAVREGGRGEEEAGEAEGEEEGGGAGGREGATTTGLARSTTANAKVGPWIAGGRGAPGSGGMSSPHMFCCEAVAVEEGVPVGVLVGELEAQGTVACASCATSQSLSV